MNSINNLLPILIKDFPDIKFQSGKNFAWSPKERKITYTTHQSVTEHGMWSLLHEVAHAMLGHVNYQNDFDLLKLETKTWHKAKILGKKYGINIDNEHIQDCLDTYRDWLHSRAKCPRCGVVSLQRNDGLYQCFNCKNIWKVSYQSLSLIKN
jgi:ribosomal protein L37AE/L43A